MPARSLPLPLVVAPDPAEQAMQAPVLVRLVRGEAYHRQHRVQSFLARVSEGLAALSLPVAVVAVLLTRSGQLAPLSGVALLCVAVALAAGALAVGVVAGLEIWQRGTQGIARLVRSGLFAALVLAYPAWLAFEAVTLPVLAEVSTDTLDPPVFSTRAGTVAARGGFRPGEASRRERLAQVANWPRLKTLPLEMEEEEAFLAVVEAARTLKWEVTEQIHPLDSRGRGRLEAVVYSRLMRLPQDVTIRFRSSGGTTRVDVRSRSRFGRHDFGANARLVQRLFDEMTVPGE